MIKVSVVIPTFKRPHLLKRLLISLTKQSFCDFEVLVVDDCSPVITEYHSLIREFQEHFYSLAYIRNEKNLGLSFSRNRGITEAKGELVAFVDDDDEWLPQKLEEQVKAFEKGTSNLGLVYTWTKAIKNDTVIYENKAEYSGSPFKELLLNNFIAASSVMVKKAAIIDAGLFDETMRACEDWDMWTRMLHKGYAIDVIKSVLTLYYKHDEESLGLSPHAKKGYEIYYQKHLPLYGKYHKFKYVKMKLKRFLKSVKQRIEQLAPINSL